MPLQAHALRSRMSLLALSVTTPSATLTTAALRHELEFDIPHGLVQTIASSSGPKKRPGSQRRQAILKRAIEYITESPMIPIRVSDLCRVTGTSERTLEYAFKEHYGVSPKRFITNTRFNGVRKRLLKAMPGELNITDVANGWGFWHMGQFAADYRRLFDELPSDTLNRSNA